MKILQIASNAVLFFITYLLYLAIAYILLQRYHLAWILVLLLMFCSGILLGSFAATVTFDYSGNTPKLAHLLRSQTVCIVVLAVTTLILLQHLAP